MTPEQLRVVLSDDKIYIFNAESAIPSGATTTSSPAALQDGIKIGSILNSTSSTYVGTTATIALYGSNDNITYAAVMQDDNVTPCSFTLAAASSTYTWELKAAVFKYYRILYTKGDASVGTITSILAGKK